MSRIFAAALAMAGCLIGAHLSVNPASADGPLGGLSDSGLVPASVDTYLICCAPIVTSDPEPVLESLPFSPVEDTLEPILSSDPLDVAPDNPIIDPPPEAPVLPTPPPLEPPEAVLPPADEPGSVSPPSDNRVPGPEPAPIEARAGSPEASVVLTTKPPQYIDSSDLARSARIADRPVKPAAGVRQAPGPDPSGLPADIPTARLSPATLLAPFDGAGLFEPTAGRDSVLALMAALLVLAALWAWLRRQQRQRDRLVVSLTDSPRDEMRAGSEHGNHEL